MSNTADQQHSKLPAPVEQPQPPTLEEIRINSIIRTLSSQRDVANNQILKVTASMAVAEHQLAQFANQAESFRNQAQALVANNMAFADRIHALEDQVASLEAANKALTDKCTLLEAELRAKSALPESDIEDSTPR